MVSPKVVRRTQSRMMSQDFGCSQQFLVIPSLLAGILGCSQQIPGLSCCSQQTSGSSGVHREAVHSCFLLFLLHCIWLNTCVIFQHRTCGGFSQTQWIELCHHLLFQPEIQNKHVPSPRRLLWIRFIPVLFSVEVIALFPQCSKAFSLNCLFRFVGNIIFVYVG